MGGLYLFGAHAFGPAVQVLFALLVTSLIAWGICAAAYRSEKMLLRSGRPLLWTAPLPLLACGLLYGGLRFSGLQRYSSDGWDQWGRWNYTHQNSGAYILFFCGCLLTGLVLAICREKAPLKK